MCDFFVLVDYSSLVSMVSSPIAWYTRDSILLIQGVGICSFDEIFNDLWLLWSEIRLITNHWNNTRRRKEYYANKDAFKVCLFEILISQALSQWFVLPREICSYGSPSDQMKFVYDTRNLMPITVPAGGGIFLDVQHGDRLESDRPYMYLSIWYTKSLFWICLLKILKNYTPHFTDTKSTSRPMLILYL
jgi:hypothetical protein